MCNARFGERGPNLGGQRLVGFQQNFSGLAVYQIGNRVRAFEIGQRHVRRGHLGLDQFLVQSLGDALVRAHQHFLALGILDFVGQLAVDQAFGKIPMQVAVKSNAQRNSLHLIEGAQNSPRWTFHAQRAQENGQPRNLRLRGQMRNAYKIFFGVVSLRISTHEPR